MQERARTYLFNTELSPQRWRDASGAGAQAEAFSRGGGERVEQGDGGVQWLSQARMHGDFAEPEGSGGSYMAEA
jgi:hypothetical protein